MPGSVNMKLNLISENLAKVGMRKKYYCSNLSNKLRAERSCKRRLLEKRKDRSTLL